MRSSKKSIQFIVLIVYTLSSISMVMSLDCPRWESKLVRRLLKKEIMPFYEQLNVALPLDCPLSPAQDIYGHQEDNKFEESASRWVCEICGKAFYEERYLDQHFDNRHPETKRLGDGVVCLANFCDIFRCDVMVRASQGSASYWDHALCKEEDLQLRQNKCLKLANQCVPVGLEKEIQNRIIDHLNATLCTYLTCDNYWEISEKQVSPLSLIYYIMAGIILFLGMIIYFTMLRTQLSQQALHLSHSSDNEGKQPLLYSPANQEIRHRLGVTVT